MDRYRPTMDRLLWMHCFARAVETGSLSAVGRELGIGQPNVSRHLASLERHVGARLLHRSTRRLTLTPEGARYYEVLRPALDALEEAAGNARSDDQPQGLLRLNVPVSLARFKLIPLLPGFLARYPDIRIDLRIADWPVDLVEDGADVAIRIGELRDGRFRARRIGAAHRAVVASTSYLATRGEPRIPAALCEHDCVLYSRLATGRVWPFVGAPVGVRGPISVDNAEGVRSAVLEGLGIAMTPRWLFEDVLAGGAVRELLQDWPLPALPIHALYAERRLLPRRARVFMDFVAEAFAADPALAITPTGPRARTR